MDMSGQTPLMDLSCSKRDVIQEPVKNLDIQQMFIDQESTIMVSKMAEYEHMLAIRDNTIQALYNDITNSQNNRYVLNNQYMNIIEK